MRYSVGGVSDMQMVERWCGGIGVWANVRWCVANSFVANTNAVLCTIPFLNSDNTIPSLWDRFVRWST